mmetsp:Transcript_114554/g.302480  ORF Transcript_114554/g.302480 Transcript_114554/m.302480 type:complete len:287 (+) Transcript_114554:173-1033(+)
MLGDCASSSDSRSKACRWSSKISLPRSLCPSGMAPSNASRSSSTSSGRADICSFISASRCWRLSRAIACRFFSSSSSSARRSLVQVARGLTVRPCINVLTAFAFRPVTLPTSLRGSAMAFGSAPPSRSARTLSVLPASAATISAVRPALFPASGSADAPSSARSTAGTSPPFRSGAPAASTSAVLPEAASREPGSALLASSDAHTSAAPARAASMSRDMPPFPVWLSLRPAPSLSRPLTFSQSPRRAATSSAAFRWAHMAPTGSAGRRGMKTRAREGGTKGMEREP